MQLLVRLSSILMLMSVTLGSGSAPYSAPPERRPERVMLTFSGDPSSEMAVTWRRPVDADGRSQHGAVAQIIEARPGPDLGRGKERTVDSETTTVPGIRARHTSTTQAAYHYHTAKFTGLTPNTKYAYRVGNGDEWSEWNHFTTALATPTDGSVPAPFRFLYVGDAQNDILSLWSRVVRDGILRAPDARFTLHAGDLIDMGNDDLEWNEWFEGAGWINRVIPVVATPGNHEYSGFRRGEHRNLSALWIPQFEYPRNGLPGLEDTNYTFDYQGLRVISLDSNRRTEEQATWLDEVLTKSTSRWTVVTFHHPIYSTAAKRDNPKIREAWLPVMDKHKVDLVLQGHDHTYGRTYPLREGTIVEQGKPGGTVYVVSVSGPKMYEISTSTQQLMARRAEDTQFYQVVGVEQDQLVYESYSASGQLYDAFTLRRTPEGNLFEPRQDLPAERLRKAPVAADGE
jgi:hypothetical protein